MLLQTIFAVILAIVIVVSAYRYLKWSVIVWLGGLFFVVSAAILFINYQNDGISYSIPAGNDLFRQGDSVSVIGGYQWLAILGFATGLVLMIAGVIKRMHMPSPEIAQQPVSEPLTEQQRLEQNLSDAINEVNSDLGDPTQCGQTDAHAPGGTIPDQHATKPEGFEVDSRKSYEGLGKSFLLKTVINLKRDIKEALQDLANLRSTLGEKYYYKLAEAEYGDHALPPDSEEVKKKKVKVQSTGLQLTNFVDNLHLENYGQPEWDKPTTNTQLMILGLLFILIEFGVNYLFLVGELGSLDARNAAGLGVLAVLIASFTAAFLFQFTQLPHGIYKRALCWALYSVPFVILFIALGMLLDFRGVWSEATDPSGLTTNPYGLLSKLIDGYKSIFESINNLMLFIINLIAAGLFYWKFLLWFERYSGYRKCRDDNEEAKNDWQEMFAKNAQYIIDALSKIRDEAKNNREAAATNARGLMEKCEILNNLQGAIAPAYESKLRLAYQQSVKNYRHSNAKHRNVVVDPAPIYFKQPAEFCDITKYFTEEHGINEFLAEQKDEIALADDTRKDVDNSVVAWNNQKFELNQRLTDKFKKQVFGKPVQGG